jgi:hypothetical protein
MAKSRFAAFIVGELTVAAIVSAIFITDTYAIYTA